MPKLGRVVFRTQGRLRLVARGYLGEEAPVLTDGYAKWAIVARQKRRSITEYEGLDPFALQIPFLLDGYKNDRSVQRDIRALERMALVNPGDLEPPLVKVYGAVPRTDLLWVVSGLTWGTNVLRSERHGERVRQDGIITLLQYSGDSLLIRTSGVGRRRYLVRAGDTYFNLSRRFMDKPITRPRTRAWVAELKKINNLRDRLPVGKYILLP